VTATYGCLEPRALSVWSLILRGISIEVGGDITDRLWQRFWDFIFVFTNFVVAILFGCGGGRQYCTGVRVGAALAPAKQSTERASAATS
jgi:cytochrome bd-type quinol oxidase subunit 2